MNAGACLSTVEISSDLYRVRALNEHFLHLTHVFTFNLLIP